LNIFVVAGVADNSIKRSTNSAFQNTGDYK